jgi:hypothetical protein
MISEKAFDFNLENITLFLSRGGSPRASTATPTIDILLKSCTKECIQPVFLI